MKLIKKLKQFFCEHHWRFQPESQTNVIEGNNLQIMRYRWKRCLHCGKWECDSYLTDKETNHNFKE